jgi:glutamate carboxypeptidase
VSDPPPTAAFCRRLERLVNIDSPSGGREQEQVAAAVLEWLEPLGCTYEWVTEPDNPARSLAITLAGGGDTVIALLGHPDTVFPAGTAAERPFLRAGQRCLGPGVADMKGGLVLAAMAMERWAAASDRPFGELRLLICADEELRLRAPAIADRTADAGAALVFECARENGDLVSTRKGAVWRTMRVDGRAAHAGADTAGGRSAVSALAEEILRIEALSRGRPAMTSVITTVGGGDAPNTVPAHAWATIDIRSSHPPDLTFALHELDRRPPRDGITITIEDRGTWPPMPRAEWLAEAALAEAPRLGLEIGEQLSGGVSDGCWTAERGVPTVDGLGPVGARDHTPEEWIDVRSLGPRLELAVRLIGCAARRAP